MSSASTMNIAACRWQQVALTRGSGSTPSASLVIATLLDRWLRLDPAIGGLARQRREQAVEHRPCGPLVADRAPVPRHLAVAAEVHRRVHLDLVATQADHLA